jgi:heme exporter protein A
VVLTGANGSGKSSLLRLVAGLLRPAAGQLSWGTEPVAADPVGHRLRLHYVGHQDALKPAMTPREMLNFWAALRGLQQRHPAAALDRAFTVFNLEAVADWPCRWLSAGQQRRVALARLLVSPAPLWLLDEPTSVLDDDSQAGFEQAVAAHRAAGGRVMLATHLPVALDAAAILKLDDFAPRAGDLDPDSAG